MASERIEKLLAAQQKAEAQKRKAEQQLKAAKHKISMQRNKERTHRLCERGGHLEHYLPAPELLTDEDVFLLIDYFFSSPRVRLLVEQMTASRCGEISQSPKELIEAAQAVEKAGAFMLVLEGIPEKLAAIITKKVHIPTIGIGASPECDGQVLVYQDMLAMYGNFVPKFVKQFAQVGEVMQGAVKDYINAVKEGTFPGPENTYAISDDVIEKLY